MVNEVATAAVALVPSARGFGTALNRQVGPQVTRSGALMGAGLGKSLLKGFIVFGVAAKVTSFISDSLSEGREAQKSAAATAAIIKATGGAANVTTKYIEGLTGRLSQKVGVDDEAIASGANLLLTFKNIRNELGGPSNLIFQRATKSMLDLSAAGFGSTESAAKQLGKALNDPVKGMSALSRAGVTFSEAQQEQIKRLVESNNLLGAQKIILREVESQVGGVAEATATSSEKAGVAFSNLKEQIGTALIPAVDRLAVLFSDRIAPAISTFVTNLQSGKGSAGAFGSFIRDRVVPALQGFSEWVMEKVVPAIREWLVPILKSAKDQFNKIRDAIKDNEPELRKLFRAFKKVVEFWLTEMLPVGGKIAGFLITVLGTAIKVIISLAGFWIRTFTRVRDAVNSTKEAISKAAGGMKFQAQKIILAFKTLPARLKVIGGNIIDGLVAGIRAAAGKVSDAVSAIVDKIPSKIRDLMGIGSPSKVTRLLGEFIGEGLAQGIESKASRVANALQKVIDGLKDKLSGFRDDFVSLSDSVAGAFTGSLFEAETGAGFVTDLLGTKGQLTALKAAFKKLVGYGLKPAFLSQLFASGNGGLILDLAAGSKAQAAQAGTLFGEVGALSTSLGNAVARNELGPKMDKISDTLDDIAALIKKLPPGIGKEINGAARAGSRRAA